MAIITISRGSFAGGRAVAEQLGQRLHHPVLSREDVLREAAQKYGIQEQELVRVLTETPSYWQQALGKRLTYVKCVTAVLLDHARDGSLVYHGHVGHLLLTGISHVLRVRVIADLEYRVQAARQQSQLTREQAIAHIQRVDADRSRWARFLYGVDWEDLTQYCLVLNLSQLSVDSACETVVRMASLPEFQPSTASQQRFDDLQLSSRVWATMAANPLTRSSGIEVTARAGDVVIRGAVGSAKALELIPQLAASVPGVKHVQCEAGMGADWYW